MLTIYGFVWVSFLQYKLHDTNSIQFLSENPSLLLLLQPVCAPSLSILPPSTFLPSDLLICLLQPVCAPSLSILSPSTFLPSDLLIYLLQPVCAPSPPSFLRPPSFLPTCLSVLSTGTDFKHIRQKSVKILEKKLFLILNFFTNIF